ncbi:phosphatidate cytidylyltransferase [Lacticaseibacillus pantheris]|jgi:phosphatidate cytidylyltransferase|uniref:Phosphatidate cytidylyltransferase n=1 Tax=Lacticaseibacillus pantheris DSM 15945 = JCM 12539 = NBRC 106106 TaxID=1423783 RepID=A0A0R1U5N2_9LACO|nr:phosphatidate cytidylyltransferase [Lacticaseibacillus pantheris]KRL86778.1 CDP-diglyceride synthetase [Lacticaseibacillus pantheris DSM 15945 = JCM 12539 = NBRC 106106]WKF85444.1 phosphatidate cytidylyltransferase [Lacticaseibacillus pantheris]
MKQRVITAVVALIIFIPILIVGGPWVDLAAAVLALVGISEIFIMRKKIIVSVEALVAALGTLAVVLPDQYLKWILQTGLSRIDLLGIFMMVLLLLTVTSKNKTNFDNVSVTMLGILYVGTGFHYFDMARNQGSLALLMFGMLIVWLTDSGAYIFGRAFGKHKLWPAISPNKTWEGSIGGVVIAMIFAAIYGQFFDFGYSLPVLILIALFLSIWGQLGDLVESALKRYYGVKDSGKILPGHGGILDRFDSMLFVLPMLHWLGFV